MMRRMVMMMMMMMMQIMMMRTMMMNLTGKCGSAGDQVEGNGAASGDERGRGKKGNLFHLVFFF